MKYDISVNSCRICLTKNKKIRSLYKPIDEGDEPPHGMLQKITGISVEEMEKFTMLPKNICKNCELSLSMAFEFREKALHSQETIKAYMQYLQIPYPEEEEEEKPKSKEKQKQKDKFKDLKQEDDDLIEVQQLDENTLEENLQMLEHNNSTELHLEELQMPEKCENDYDLEVHGAEEFTEETLDDDIETFEVDENGDSYQDEEELHEEHYVEVENDDNDVVQIEHDGDGAAADDDEDNEHLQQQQQQQYEEELQHEYLSEKENTKAMWNITAEEIEIDEIIGRTRSKRLPPRGKQPSKLPKQISYICDICGNVFSQRGRMMEHRQRHDKQLKYSCELCDEKFHMRELLRKHMYSHSGGKPLKCKYCSRTFYYESVRKAHEAVHQGVKPYVCDECGKPFSYAHSLKKHKLIHAEVKLYRCEYCNKDFRLQHHMKQHKQTRLHKKAVNLAENRYDKHNITIDLDNDDELTDDVMMEEEEIEEEEIITNTS